MQRPVEVETNRLLAGATLWARVGDDAGAGDRLVDGLALVAGWEDAFAACAPFVGIEDGEGCGACQVPLVAAVLARGLPAAGRCRLGVGLLAFPAPAGSRDAVAVLRLDGPTPQLPASATPTGRPVLAAARRLRSPAGLAAWQAEQRARAAQRNLTAAATITQLVDTAEAFHRRYATAAQDRASSDQAATRLDSLARETLRDSEDAMTGIAHALHDTAAQSMVSAHRFLEAARSALGGSRPESAAGHLDAAQDRVGAAIREVRQVLNTLVPPGLEELGIAEALRIHVRDGVPPPMTADVTGDLPRTERWLEAGLFAMAAEAISNAVIHASATTVRIDLRVSRGQSIITVTDDGRGFDPGSAPRQSQEGMGLIGMTRRASWLGGRVDVTSSPGAGTTVRIAVPLAGAATDDGDTTAAMGQERA